MSESDRVAAAQCLLRAAGFERAVVQVAGHDLGIAVVTGVGPAAIPSLAALATRVKALGFRYVTLDISGFSP